MSSRWIRRLLLLVAFAAVAYVVGFGGYGFMVGSPEYLAGTPRDTNCETPGSRYGWAYEAVNYDAADDAVLLAANKDPAHCTSQGTVAGTAVQAPDGVHLDAWYIPRTKDPVAADGTAAPTVVIVHGGKSDKSGMLPYAPAFHDTYNLLIVDLRNSGRSSLADSTGGLHEQNDLRAMIDWLVAAKHPRWLAVMGNSNGASTALAEAIGDTRVSALILDSMHASVERQIGNVISTERHLPAWPGAWALVFGVSVRLGESVEAVDPIRTIVQLRGRPILLTHGTIDHVDRPADSLELNVAAARAAGVDVEVRTCPGADHGKVVLVCTTEWGDWVRAFLDAHVTRLL